MTLNHIGTFSVIPGKVARDFNENGAFERQVFGVAKIVKDRNYNGKSSYNRGDLAFVVLDNLIKYQVNVAPICLNPENDGWALQTGQKATVFGWGFTTSSGAPSEVLRTLVVPYMPLEKCRENATDVFRPFILDG